MKMRSMEIGEQGWDRQNDVMVELCRLPNGDVSLLTTGDEEPTADAKNVWYLEDDDWPSIEDNND